MSPPSTIRRSFLMPVLAIVGAGCFNPAPYPFDPVDAAPGDSRLVDAHELLDAPMTDVAVDGATDASPDAAPDAPPPAPTLSSISPALGTVKGGTAVMIEGTQLQAGATIAIGGIPCTPAVVMTPTLLVCTTGDSNFVEGARDVVVTNPDGVSATLSLAFTYQCPWMTSQGRRSCGAVPPRPSFPTQVVTTWVTQFQAGHAFVANTTPAGSTDNLDDTVDAVLGTQSASIETDGAGTPRLLTRTGLPPIDFSNHVPKIWVKLTNVTSTQSLQLVLGDSNLANHYRFSFHSTQAQRWTTEGDWVALTLSWSPQNYTVQGTPNRAAITDVQFRIIDNASGTRLRFQVNGIALVEEPIAKYPQGVVSITFDDGFGSMVTEGAPVLVARGYPATAYVIQDLVGDPGRATLAELQTLHGTHGWEIAAHAHLDANHAARFTNIAATVLEDDMVDVRAWLIANGFTGYDHCAYPGGTFTGGIGTDVLGLTRTYFATCRTIYQGERETYPPSDSHKLRVFYITNTTTLASAIAAIDAAHASREWIILVFHRLVASPSVSTEWRTSDFEMLVAHIAATGMPVKTIGQVLTP